MEVLLSDSDNTEEIWHKRQELRQAMTVLSSILGDSVKLEKSDEVESQFDSTESNQRDVFLFICKM